MKTCTSCKAQLPPTAFSKNRSKSDGLHNLCRPCNARSAKKYRDSHEDIRLKHRVARYGLTLEQYRAMVEAQEGRCAICGEPEGATYRGKVRRLCVDHNHETGEVRGLLCVQCNFAIGHLADNPDRARRLVAYLLLFGRSA